MSRYWSEHHTSHWQSHKPSTQTTYVQLPYLATSSKSKRYHCWQSFGMISRIYQIWTSSLKLKLASFQAYLCKLDLQTMLLTSFSQNVSLTNAVSMLVVIRCLPRICFAHMGHAMGLKWWLPINPHNTPFRSRFTVYIYLPKLIYLWQCLQVTPVLLELGASFLQPHTICWGSLPMAWPYRLLSRLQPSQV